MAGKLSTVVHKTEKSPRLKVPIVVGMLFPREGTLDRVTSPWG
jgi:hypothetical protein